MNENLIIIGEITHSYDYETRTHSWYIDGEEIDINDLFRNFDGEKVKIIITKQEEK